MSAEPAPVRLSLPADATPVREAAQLYVAAGFAPVPVWGLRDGGACACGGGDCAAAGKHPVGQGWQRRARCDVDVARELFARHEGNIGIVLGPGYVVIDVDDYHGGREALDQLGPLPPTLTQRSGSWQGEHRIYAVAPGQDPNEVTNRSIAPGLDVKTRTGQIVVAPSLHRSGHRYQWIDPSPPAPLPDALYEQIRRRRVVPIRAAADAPAAAGATAGALSKRAAAYLARLPGAVSGQGGHAAAFAAARALAGWMARGLSEAEAWSLFLAYNARCSPPWTEAELRHKFADAKRADHIPAHADRPRPAGAGPAASGAPPAPPPEAESWRQHLLYERKRNVDVPAKHHHNAVVVLRYCPAWAGRIIWDEHARRVLVTRPPWHPSEASAPNDTEQREWTDTDDARLSSWVRLEVTGLTLPVCDCGRAVQIVAEANPVHPFRAWLDVLAWDGVERLPHWLSDYLGVPSGPFAERVGVWWMLSAVARTYKPGCKADYVLILEGSQGTQKSTALSTLVGDRWFSDTPLDLRDKDAYQALPGKVVIELAELDTLRRADVERAKSFFSSRVDRYRESYGRRSRDVPRGCVFAGTTNHKAYLTDDTGNRRYWPVQCGEVNRVHLADAREQLWAEAVHRYRQGERWWPATAEEHQLCGTEQEERRQGDAWYDVIAGWVGTREQVGIAMVWELALRGQIDRLTRADEMRISAILRELGYARRRMAEDDTGKRAWRYIREA